MSPELSQYLSPEPMLQDPKWVKDEASAGFSAPTYAYARNNPLRYTDPTGLFSWRVECPALGAMNRGAVFSYIDVFSAPPVKRFGMGASGLDTASGDACEDLDIAIDIEKQNKGNPDFWIQRDCWKALKQEIQKHCHGIQKAPQEPKPKPGYCAQ